MTAYDILATKWNYSVSREWFKDFFFARTGQKF